MTTEISQKINVNILRIIQDCISLVPVIVIGSGASATFGIAGMGELANYLIDNIKPTEIDAAAWNDFKDELLKKNSDLETALHNIKMTSTLEIEIIKKTRDLIRMGNNNVLNWIIKDNIKLPLSTLFSHLHNTTVPKIKVITTNYDCLIEYALDTAKLGYDNGFHGNYIKNYNGFNRSNRLTNNCFQVLKVHGSLDWYNSNYGNLVSINDAPDTYTPLMVTPGIRKYEHTHNEPFRSIITKSDEAFESANSILCIGYGFNDIHIQPKLMSRIRDSKIPLVIITRTLSSKALEVLKTSNNQFVIGIECCDKHTRIITHTQDLEVEGNFWALDGFLSLIL